MREAGRRFESLTWRGQVRRLTGMARAALADYGLEDARLAPLTYWHNATSRVDAP